jgi:flagellar assembly factor FliW
VQEYEVRLEPADLEKLQLSASEQAYVLGIIGRDQDTLTLNLRAPLVINLTRRIGFQIITVDNQPLQYDLAVLPMVQRRSA